MYVYGQAAIVCSEKNSIRYLEKNMMYSDVII